MKLTKVDYINLNMINILKSKLKNTYKKKSLNSSNIMSIKKDFFPAVRDWKNSIYVYNKNALNLIPVASRIVIKLIKQYLNSYNINVEYIVRIKRKVLFNRYRKLSVNKIFVNNGEFKHTNDKVNITLSIYNRQRLNYLLIIKKKYQRLFKNRKFLKKLTLIRNIGLNIIKSQEKKGKIITNVLPNYNSKVFYIQNLYYNYFVKKSLRRFKYFLYYKQLLYINKAKFENSYIQGLIGLISKIFNKNVEFNIINLKYFFLNSDIYIEPLMLKLRKKNRKSLLRYINTLFHKLKIKSYYLEERPIFLFDISRSFTLNNNDITNNLLNNLTEQNLKSSKDLRKVVLNNIKYKRISGAKLEISGRLTKRRSAGRAQHKMRYHGNLRNVYTSLKHYKISKLKSNIKPNLNYTNLNSKVRGGAFGVKG